jgi:hypothetical protein
MQVPSNTNKGTNSPESSKEDNRLNNIMEILGKVRLKPGEKPLTMQEIVEECRIVRAEHYYLGRSNRE